MRVEPAAVVEVEVAVLRPVADARGVGEDVADGGRAVRGHDPSAAVGVGFGDGHVLPLGNPALDSVVELEVTALVEAHQRHTGDRLGHRGQPPDGVGFDRQGALAGRASRSSRTSRARHRARWRSARRRSCPGRGSGHAGARRSTPAAPGRAPRPPGRYGYPSRCCRRGRRSQCGRCWSPANDALQGDHVARPRQDAPPRRRCRRCRFGAEAPPHAASPPTSGLRTGLHRQLGSRRRVGSR